MRVLNQITFEAKDDAEALKLASERLGKDAVILSTRVVRVGGFMGFFQRPVLQVSAGILQDDSRPEKKEKEKDDAAAKERLVAFQKLLEFKQATETREGGVDTQEARFPEAAHRQRQPIPQNEGTSTGKTKVIYSPVNVSPVNVGGSSKDRGEFDSVHISQAGLANTAREIRDTQVFPGENGDDEALKLREEVDFLSKRLDSILKRVNSKRDGSSVSGFPEVASVVPEGMEDVYQRLISSEVEPDYALSLVKEYQEHKAHEPFVKWLGSKIRCAADANPNALGGKRVMLFGPTGAGKTTTIAKLAAIKALWEQKNVLLLTSDTYRIAAVDQLRTYAKILGVPIEVIFEVENITRILADHEDAELILLDTAGRGQKDRKNLEAFEALHKVFEPDAVHLVLAANMKYKDMLDVVKRIPDVPVSHVIFTKLDETVSYGALFNVLKLLDRPASFFTTGQNVPNDIEVASGERLAGLLLGDEIRSAAS